MPRALAMAIGGSLTLIDEPFLKAKGEPRSGAISVISIVSVAFAGQQQMQNVVTVVIPLCIKIAGQMAGGIVVVFEH